MNNHYSAREHILRWGLESPFYTKYFGNASTSTPLGWYDRIAFADRGRMLFRCDDPDRNCATQNSKSRRFDAHVFRYTDSARRLGRPLAW